MATGTPHPEADDHRTPPPRAGPAPADRADRDHAQPAGDPATHDPPHAEKPTADTEAHPARRGLETVQQHIRQLDELAGACDRQMTAFAERFREARRLEHERRALDDDRAALQADRAAADRHAEELDRRAETLHQQQADLDHTRAERTAEQKRLQTLRQSLETQQRDLEQARAALAEREAELRRTRDDLEQRQSDLDQRASAVARREAQAAEQAQHHAEQAEQLEQQRADLAAREQQLTARQRELSRQKARTPTPRPSPEDADHPFADKHPEPPAAHTERSRIGPFMRRLAGRLLFTLMLLTMLGGIGGAYWWYEHRAAEHATQVAGARQALRDIETQARLQASIGQVRTTAADMPLGIEPNWFERMPVNPFVGPEAPRFETVGPDRRNLIHPPVVVAGPDRAAFWYNPFRGVVRARVPERLTRRMTIDLYNRINQSDLTPGQVQWPTGGATDAR